MSRKATVLCIIITIVAIAIHIAANQTMNLAAHLLASASIAFAVWLLLQPYMRARPKERDARAWEIESWLDSHMTYYDVDENAPREGTNIPALASVSRRIWYHATDDQTGYPFSEVCARSRHS